MLLDGMHLPLTTPFFPDGRLNLRKLEQNVARYSLTPASGMIVLGPNSEANLLTDAEAEKVLRTAIEAASLTKVMLANVTREGVSATLDRIESAAFLGYDAVVVGPPPAEVWGGAGRRIHLQSIADRSSLPILLAGDIPLDLVAELASHPKILGLLNNFASEEEVRLVLQRTATVQRVVTVTPVFTAVTGRMASSQANRSEAVVSAESLLAGGTAVATAPAKAALKTRTKTAGFQVLIGGTAEMLPGLLAGAVGVVSPFSIAAPQACHEVLAAWKDGDTPLAEEKQLRLIEAAAGVEETLGVAGLKYGCDLNGYFGGLPRLPLLPLLGEQKAAVERLMQGLRS